MYYRQLGHSGLKVSTLIFGTMSFGGEGMFDAVGSGGVKDAKRQIDMALDAGVNMIDTAALYSHGKSQEIVGQAIKGKRDGLLLASKVRFPFDDDPNSGGLSRYHIMRGCEASLKRLGTDHLDLYWAHEWDGVTPIEEMLRAFEDLQRDGKIGYVGVSNWSAWHIMKALGIAASGRLVRPVSQQIHYTLQAREAEHELVPIGIDQGLSLVCWSPLAAGILSGKYTRANPDPSGTRRAQGWSEPPVHDWDALWRIVDVLEEVGKAHGVSLAQVSPAWLLTRPAVASLVIGARNEEQLADNLAAADLELSDEEVRRLEEASCRPLPYPYWY